MPKDISSDLAALLGRCTTGIAALFQQTAVPSQRAVRLAELLYELTPRAQMTVCLLRDDPQSSCLAVRPKEDALSAEEIGILRSQLSSPQPPSADVGARPSRLLTATIGEPGRTLGLLAIDPSGGATAKEVTRAESLLAAAAPTVALHWTLENERAERVELTRFALVGQAFLGLAHDLNNALNSMMLQTSVLQLRVDEKTRSELAAVRQHGAQAAGMIRSLQHVVQERREQSCAVDVDGVVAALLEEDAELRRRVAVQWSGQAPSIHGTRGAVRQLFRILLEGVLAGTKSTVTVRTETRDGHTLLSMKFAAVSAAMDEEGETSPADVLLWNNLDEIARLAGQSLLRQLSGVLEVDGDAEGEWIVCVRWG